MKKSDDCKFEDMPDDLQSICQQVRKDFLRQGGYEPTSFVMIFGKMKEYKCGELFNRDRKQIEKALIIAARAGARATCWVSEAWMVAARMGDQSKAMQAAMDRKLHLHPDRIEAIQISYETPIERWIAFAEIKRDPLLLLPWRISFDTRLELDRMAKMFPPVTFQNIFAKAGR
jgi:hypothetical protein